MHAGNFPVATMWRMGVETGSEGRMVGAWFRRAVVAVARRRWVPEILRKGNQQRLMIGWMGG